MEPHLRAGIAIYNAGYYHAAHDAWEDHWLALDAGTADERFLHGLIQFTAAVHHGGNANWAGVQGLAESALAYLDGLRSPYHGVTLDPVREYLDELAADPRSFEDIEPPALNHDGVALQLTDLDFGATAVAATVLAEELGYDESVVEDAVRYAADGVEGGPAGRFVALVMDFASDGANRELVFQRLRAHVERRRAREADVDGLFDD